ncbi:hypothetical protein GH714_033689 [Hevea brasiliensis]|uniref:HVA22-like protein n=1 Tax=Hevea brasiliensis TaxID=3981 RepID=A0A6A6LRD2_HEVBR|nr:hypothetical protein GH714_033689 [Hevea brasiliensis]
MGLLSEYQSDATKLHQKLIDQPETDQMDLDPPATEPATAQTNSAQPAKDDKGNLATLRTDQVDSCPILADQSSYRSWLPFWAYIKLVFCMWLVLPTFNGAAYIYENLVRKYVKIGGRASGSYSEDQRKILQMMSLDARKSVAQYVEKYGWDAFERAIRAAEREVKKH